MSTINKPKSDGGADRLAAALRANLRKRKDQARGSATTTDLPPADLNDPPARTTPR